MFRSPISTSTRTRLGAATLVACAVAMGVGARFADDAADGREDTALVPIAELVADDTLDPRIVAMELDGTIWDERVAALEAVLFAQRDATRRLETTSDALAEARIDLAVVARDLATAARAADAAEGRIDEHRRILQARALELFVSHGEEEQLDELQSVDDATEGARHRQLASEVDDHQLALLDELEAEREGLEVVIADLEGRELALTTSVAALEQSLAIADADLTRADADLPAAIDAVRSARRGASIPGLDLSVVALDAYLRTEVALGDEEPSCRITWWMLAGVGRVESRHGTLGGRSLDADGRPNRPIIGIALDGGPGVKAIDDTDGGVLDGDDEWDRAVGPMQFIPETWSIRGRDGNGDGIADPHNLYDAALSAGRYLCRLGGDLSDIENLRTAYFGYNTSSAYVTLVERHATRYAETELPEIGVEPA
ncbi:MAG: lytic transglycosylase domain-containing protein [Actinomycetota bacterium]